jgi:hypothetical protein
VTAVQMAQPSWEEGMHELGKVRKTAQKVPSAGPAYNGEPAYFEVNVAMRSRVRE